ncbi:MAG: tetratricopeptide repeat protein [Acidobacteriaceae bacterium]|nr:tetratricopeptide repeat protein [Acidobacteriaceae bacterium]
MAFQSTSQSTSRLGTFSMLPLCLLALMLFPALLQAQNASSSITGPGDENAAPKEEISTKPVQRPFAVDAAGPAISLESNEALFSIAVALNACGYDAGLAESDPVRQRVRDDVNAALLGSSIARDDRDVLCRYISNHRLSDPSHDLAQYVSLAVYLTPQLALSVGESDMPPDANAVANMLPELQAFARSTQLHLIWVKYRPEYEALTARLHEPLTRMILETNVYLKQPTSAYDGRRFLVLLEPMLSPAETNARIYGTDYILATSPLKTSSPTQLPVRLDQIRHIYLHYEIEPLVYARSSSIARLAPLLGTVQDAPLEYVYKNDVIALVTECLIKGIEARTLEIPDARPRPPASKDRSDQADYDQRLSVYEHRLEQARRDLAAHDVKQGYILTQYFYQQLQIFEHDPGGLNENIGEMVYGMDVDREKHSALQVTFDREGSSDFLRRTPRQLSGLDLAEMKLVRGDIDGASDLVQKALEQKSSDAARAHFLMARIETHEGLMDDALASFQQTLALSKDPRTTAWSHIYIARIYDIQDQREKALTEYRAALASRDGRPDTKAAAEKGLQQPFVVPRRTEDPKDSGPLDPTGKAEKDSYKPEPITVPTPKH